MASSLVFQTLLSEEDAMRLPSVLTHFITHSVRGDMKMGVKARTLQVRTLRERLLGTRTLILDRSEAEVLLAALKGCWREGLYAALDDFLATPVGVPPPVEFLATSSDASLEDVIRRKRDAIFRKIVNATDQSDLWGMEALPAYAPSDTAVTKRLYGTQPILGSTTSTSYTTMRNPSDAGIRFTVLKAREGGEQGYKYEMRYLSDSTRFVSVRLCRNGIAQERTLNLHGYPLKTETDGNDVTS